MAEGRREQLLDAAERVILRKGLAAATVADVTSEAGVAKGTFYLYFATKDDVVNALKQRMYDFLLERVVEAATAVTETGDWWGQLDAALEAIVDFDAEHAEWHRLAMQSPFAAPTDMHAYEGQIISVMTEALRRGTEEGVLDAADPELMTVMLYAAGQAVSHYSIMDNEGPDRDRCLRAMQTLFRKALAPPGTTPPPPSVSTSTSGKGSPVAPGS